MASFSPIDWLLGSVIQANYDTPKEANDVCVVDQQDKREGMVRATVLGEQLFIRVSREPIPAATPLIEKIGLRVGRLQLIVAKLAQLSRDAEEYIEDTTGVLESIAGMAVDYGPKWLDETADLLKEWYNRRAGP